MACRGRPYAPRSTSSSGRALSNVGAALAREYAPDALEHRVLALPDDPVPECDAVVSTGHALTAGGGGYGPAPTNLVLSGGGAASEEELCAPIERGIYVTRLWYVNVVHPTQTLLTGMTRDGTFLIEDGKVTRPLRDVRFTDSVLGILERTEALTMGQRHRVRAKA